MDPQREWIDPTAVSGQPLQTWGGWDGETFQLVPANEDGLFAESGDLAQPGDAYVVVDDLDEGLAVLVVSPWPVADDYGRARFTGPESFQLGVDREAFEELVRRARLEHVGDTDEDRARAERPLRIGDVFCAGAFSSEAGAFEDLRQIAERDVGGGRVGTEAFSGLTLSDVTEMARGAAKLAFYSAIAPAMDARTYAHIVRDRNVGGRGELFGEPEIGA